MQQPRDGRFPLGGQGARDGSRRRGPFHFLEHTLQWLGEGVEDAGSEGLGDLVDVVEELGCSALGILLQTVQLRVQRAELPVGLQGGIIVGGAELRLCLFTRRTSAESARSTKHEAEARSRSTKYGARSTERTVLPQHMDLLEQLEVGGCHVQALQRVEHGFEARDGLVAGL